MQACSGRAGIRNHERDVYSVQGIWRRSSAVSVIAFPGTGNWPILIAKEKGSFAQSGIEVILSPIPNSVFQMTNLIAGKFDIAMTAADNVIAYKEGQDEAPLSRQPDLFISRRQLPLRSEMV